MNKPDMKGWTPEQIKAYEEAAAALAAEEKAIDAIRAGQQVVNPEEMIERLREQAADARAARERAAREAEDDAAYRKARRKHGGEKRVARIRTFEGSIVMRAMTAVEWQDFSERIVNLESEADILRVAQEATLETIEHPARTRVLEITKLLPRLWAHLYAARDHLVTGVEEEARGKG